MNRDFVDFIKYNNAFVFIVGIFFFSFGVSFAASPDVREGIYASESTVVSVDNGAIVSADLDNFNFNLRISAITEDEKNYYATYAYQTLTVEDSIWQIKETEKTLTVNKEALEGKDLGLYIAKELGENINYELSYLKRVQKLEREKGESQKIVTTEYSGLIGKLLNPKEEVIEGYNPVIPEVVPDVPATPESNPQEVIVSTPYAEPDPTPSEEVQVTTPDSPPAPEEPENTPVEEVPVPEPESAPAPEEMINEELVQEVVKELLTEETTQTPTEEVVVPAPEPTPVPEVVSESPTEAIQ